jgi:hypothetical protein
MEPVLGFKIIDQVFSVAVYRVVDEKTLSWLFRSGSTIHFEVMSTLQKTCNCTIYFGLART